MPEMPEKKSRKKRTTARTTATRKRTTARRVTRKPLLTATLSLTRSTKGTHVFSDESDNAPVPSLYVRKGAFNGEPPQSLTLTLA